MMMMKEDEIEEKRERERERKGRKYTIPIHRTWRAIRNLLIQLDMHNDENEQIINNTHTHTHVSILTVHYIVMLLLKTFVYI